MYVACFVQCSQGLTGPSVLRCTNSGNNDCGFFIWEEEEPTQRDTCWAEDPREQLRRLVDSEVRIYETKLESLRDSVSVLGDQLDQLEVEDHQ